MATDTDTDTEPDVADVAGSRLDHRLVDRLLRGSLYTVAALIMLFLWVPLLIMIVLSFADPATTLAGVEELTLDNYQLAVSDENMWSALRGSLAIATASATIATVLGVLASFALTRFGYRFLNVFRTFGILPMIIPGVILGVGLRIYFREVFAREWLGLVALLESPTGFVPVVLAHSVYGLPFVLLVVTARLYTFDESLESFEDFIRALFLTKFSTPVVTQWMFQQIENLNAPKLNPVATMIVAIIAVALAVAMNVGNVTGYVAGTVDDEE
ncbi:ABC transporter permease [Halobacteriales archaeon QS_8_69_73]|nr:MAG: ABC transporter permease [Halobacteriales archaeon QS_8_69_73]